jgi:GMP reductase
MPTIKPTKSIYFNDVVLLQRAGVVESRKNIPNELYRVIVSPMDALIGRNFVIEAAKCGLSIAIPRSYPLGEKFLLYSMFNSNKINEKQICFMGFGLDFVCDDESLLNVFSTASPNILFDIANGLIPQLGSKIDRFLRKSKYKYSNNESIMVGNVHTGVGYRLLFDIIEKYPFSDVFIRVGIGNGSGCRTYDETHINRGQITELIECFDARTQINKAGIFTVSDGGISKPGYAAAAFGAGADYVLMGGYFTGAIEAETNINGDGTYWGCASDKQNKISNLNKHSEGKVYKIEKELKPLSEICYQLWGGLSSAVSYSGYKTLSDFIGRGIFEIKENSLPPKKRY